jgi:hypothetical protein
MPPRGLSPGWLALTGAPASNEPRRRRRLRRGGGGGRRRSLHDAQILARHAGPRTTEHYDYARGSLDRPGVHFLTAYVAGV